MVESTWWKLLVSLEFLIEILAPFKLEGIGACLLCGTLIGLERQFSGKPAGIRTSVLICFSTYIFACLSQFLVCQVGGDSTRVLGQVVTGDGFLGGGVIIARKGFVLGVTSAAIIWLLAALGCLIAFGYELQSLIFTGISLFVLIGVHLIERMIRKIKSKARRNLRDKINDRKDS